MPRPALLRLLLTGLLACAAVLATGCGNREATHTVGQTEGVYVDVDEMTYQIQLSRILNPADIEDRAYLRGLGPGVANPGKGEAWFGVFMRVSNPTKAFRVPTSNFTIVDTLGGKFTPVPIYNSFTYEPRPLSAGGVFPDVNAVAGQGVVGGGLILFKISLTSLANRPLEFRINPPVGAPPKTATAVIDLDV